MGFTIKIGQREITIRPGEYILDNGSAMMIISQIQKKKGAGRWGTFNKSYWVIPKKRYKEVQTSPLLTKLQSYAGYKAEEGYTFYVPRKEAQTDEHSDIIRNS
jgi:hypothetical protein